MASLPTCYTRGNSNFVERVDAVDSFTDCPANVNTHLHILTCTPLPVHPYLHTLTCTPSPTHPHLHSLTCTSSPAHPHLNTLTCTPSPIFTCIPSPLFTCTASFPPHLHPLASPSQPHLPLTVLHDNFHTFTFTSPSCIVRRAGQLVGNGTSPTVNTFGPSPRDLDVPTYTAQLLLRASCLEKQWAA